MAATETNTNSETNMENNQIVFYYLASNPVTSVVFVTISPTKVDAQIKITKENLDNSNNNKNVLL